MTKDTASQAIFTPAEQEMTTAQVVYHLFIVVAVICLLGAAATSPLLIDKPFLKLALLIVTSVAIPAYFIATGHFVRKNGKISSKSNWTVLGVVALYFVLTKGSTGVGDALYIYPRSTLALLVLPYVIMSAISASRCFFVDPKLTWERSFYNRFKVGYFTTSLFIIHIIFFLYIMEIKVNGSYTQLTPDISQIEALGYFIMLRLVMVVNTYRVQAYSHLPKQAVFIAVLVVFGFLLIEVTLLSICALSLMLALAAYCIDKYALGKKPMEFNHE